MCAKGKVQVWTQQEGGQLLIKEKDLRRSQFHQHLDLRLLAFRNVKKYISVA